MGEENAARTRTLYGDREGRWALLDLPLGLIPPPRLAIGVPPGRMADLSHLGEPRDVLRAVANQYAGMGSANRRGEGLPLQAAIARALGVRQQVISNYLAGGVPRLTDDQWRALVLLAFDPASVSTAMFDRAADLATVATARDVGEGEAG